MRDSFFTINPLEDPIPQVTRIAVDFLWEQCQRTQVSDNEPVQTLHVENNLKRWVKERSLLPRWSQLPYEETGDFFCVSQIWADGWGDYFALLQAASLIKKKIPTLDVHCVFQHKRPLPSIDLSSFELNLSAMHGFFETDNELSHVIEPVLSGRERLPFEEAIDSIEEEMRLDEEAQSRRVERIKALDIDIEENRQKAAALKQLLPVKAKAKSLYHKMLKAKGILHVALAFDTFTNPEMRKKSLYISESGNFQGMENAFNLHWYSMGLGPFEEGLFFNKEPPRYPRSYVAYFNRRIKSQQVFIYLIARLHAHQHETLHVKMPATDALHLDNDWLRQQGVGRVRLLDKIIEVGEGALAIEIDNPFPLPIQEYRSLIASSRDLVGCTGDGSLGDCIAAGRLPLYEMRPHKSDALHGLIQQARIVAADVSSLGDYFELLPKMLSEKTEPIEFSGDLYLHLKDGHWQKGWQKVLTELHTFYNLNETLLGRTKQCLLHPSI